MMNTLPGPDKGLFDVMFGGKTAEAVAPQAQAVIAGEQATTADFSAVMANAAASSTAEKKPVETKAVETKTVETKTVDKKDVTVKPQDQKVAQQAEMLALQPKGGKPEQKPVVQEAMPQKTPVKDAAQIVKAETKVEKSEVPVKPKQTDERKADVNAQAMAVAAQQSGNIVQPAVGGEQLKQSQSQEQGKSRNGFNPLVQGSVGPQTPIKAEQVLEIPKQAQDPKPAPAPAQAQAGTVLQPIVIQMPVAVPMSMPQTLTMPQFMSMDTPMAVELVELEEAPIKTNERPASMLSSQDFLARRTSILGVDRPDPRLMARVPAERPETALMARKFERPENEQDDYALLMPHFAVPRGEHEMVTASRNLVPSDMLMSSSKVDVSNPMALASQVNGLMARGGGTIKVRVMPENLGELTISVQTRGKQLEVHFEAATQEARNALAHALPELREALSAQRYDIGSIEVTHTPIASDGALGALGLSSTAINSTSGSGMSQWMGGERSQGDSSQNGSAWDRYFAQQDAQQQKQQGGRQNPQGYRQYQQYELGA